MNSDRLNRRDKDNGLQPQRTILSWLRTVAVIFLNALFLLKVGIRNDNVLSIGLGVILLLLATSMYAYSVSRSQELNYEIEILSVKMLIMHRVISATLIIVAFSLSIYFLYQFIYD